MEALCSLIVLYCGDIDSCRDFYQGLGLVFAEERHESGVKHYSTMINGLVFELYPKGDREVSRVRLGFRHSGNVGTFTDPDGRVVEIID